MMSRNVTCSLSLQPTGAAMILTPQKQIEQIKKVIRHEVLITERLSVSEKVLRHCFGFPLNMDITRSQDVIQSYVVVCDFSFRML